MTFRVDCDICGSNMAGAPSEQQCECRTDTDARLRDLAVRLVASGPKAAHVSVSETHEISEGLIEALDHIAILRAALTAKATPHSDESKEMSK